MAGAAVARGKRGASLPTVDEPDPSQGTAPGWGFLAAPNCCCIANMVKRKSSRSVNDGKAWKCRCGNVNQPTKHRFFMLPAFKCCQCQRQLKLDFKFCLGEIEVNGKSVTGEVWDQHNDPICVAFAYGKMAEIMERTYNIRNGMDPDNVKPINPYHLQESFDDKFSNIGTIDSNILKVGAHKVLHMGLMLRSEGIQRDGQDERYIAADVSTIPRDEFELICQCLADGIPLLGTYWAGKRRGSLGYCKIYKSPHEARYAEKGAQHRGHAVVLIGAGMKGGKRYFFFLNSWGEKFCPRKNKRGDIITAGIGKIQEEDLTKNVVRLSHPNESGGLRRLEDQLGTKMSNYNMILMMAKANQSTPQMLLKLQQNKMRGQNEEVSLDDDGIFSDDEGAYSHTSCAIHQGCGVSLGSLLRFRGKWQYQEQSYTSNARLLMNQLPVANERPQVNQAPVATMVNQTPIASLVSQTPAATGRSHMNQIHVASGQSCTNKIPGLEVNPAPMACPAKVADRKLKVEEGQMKVTRTVASKKEPKHGLIQQGTRLLKKWLLQLRSTQRTTRI